MILLNRGIAHAVLARMSASGRFQRSIAVFGAGTISRRVHDHLNHSDTGIKFVGVYDDRIGDDRINPEGLEVSGKLSDLLSEAAAGNIDDIVIALPPSAESRIADIARKLEQAPVTSTSSRIWRPTLSLPANRCAFHRSAKLASST